MAHGTVWWPGKNPQWPGIDPGTLRLVAQCLNYYATPGSEHLYVLRLFMRVHRLNILWLSAQRLRARACVFLYVRVTSWCFLMQTVWRNASMCNDVTKLSLPNHLSVILWGLLTAKRRHSISGEENKLASISMQQILLCNCKLRIILSAFLFYVFLISKEHYATSCEVTVAL